MKHRRLMSGAAAAVMLCLCSVGQQTALDAQATNPIVQTIFSTDPAPMVYGDTLYVYTGSDKDNSDFYYMPDWHCYSTKDMQNWTDEGMILSWSDFSWGKEDSAWAAQCIERNGKFYFYVTLENNTGGGRAIGVAVADSPTGPFKDAIGKPLCGPNWDYIDPTVFIDDDGQAYLMFGNPTCYYVKLKEDMITLDGEIKAFDMTVDAFGPTSREGAKTSYGEGPWLYKRGDLYYLLYASFYGTDGSESISYSTAPTITGPWTYRGQIMKKHNCFTNHTGVIDYQGHSYFFYHKVGLEGGGTFDRSVSVEEFSYNPDGSFPEIKMSDNGPEQIAALNPYNRVEAETMSWSSGIKTEPIEVGTQAIGFIESGDYVKVSGVDFGETGASAFYASVSSNGAGGTIELHLDAVNGPIIGTVDCPVTGGWQVWETVSTEVKGATGQHDLYLRFAGGESFLFNVDWWQFTESGDTTTRPGTIVDEFGGIVTPNKTSSLLGDVNGDNLINAADLSFAKMLMLKNSTDKAIIQAADVNCNGKVEADDIAWYVEYLTTRTAEYPEKVAPDYPEDNFVYDPALQLKEFPGNYTGEVSKRGQVIEEKYNGINGNKTLYVYLPPDYDSSQRYNVFYLMHGGGENEKTLFFDSSTMMQNIFDHMIEAGELDPLIVVTPTFNGCPDGAGDVWDEMRRSIVPFVEGKYSTYAESTSIEDLKASRYHRAYGGFSMGGGSTWNVLINDLDIFAYFMPLSGHCWAGVSGITQAIDKFGFQKDEYFIFAATGTEDIAYGNMVPQLNAMKTDPHFIYTSDFSQGNLYFLEAPGRTHWWGYVRHYVYDALPYFFHEHQYP